MKQKAKRPAPSSSPHPKNKTIRVLLVDDHTIVRRGLAAMLSEEKDIEIVGEVTNAGALAAMKSTRPDVAVVDITLRGAQGLDLIKTIAFDPATKIIALDLHGESTYATRAIKLGAKGYLSKEAETKLPESIRRVHAGSLAVSDDIAQQMVATLAETAKNPVAQPIEALSDRELELAEHVGKGLGPTQIADVMGISIKTVETHKAHMKKKMGIATGAQLTRYCVQWVEQRQTAQPA